MSETFTQRRRAARPGIVPIRKLIVDTAATPDADDPDEITVTIDDVTAERIAAAVLDRLTVGAVLSDPVVARRFLHSDEHPTVPGEWRHGADRGPWTGGHPIVATATPDVVGHVVTFDRVGLCRDELPDLINFLCAVYGASDPTTVTP